MGKTVSAGQPALLNELLRTFLRSREFIYIATDAQGQPYVAPKFLVSVEGDTVFLADFVLGGTWEHLRKNPRVSLSALDYDTLEGFQLNGLAELLEKGGEHDRLFRELERREISLSTDRVLASLENSRKSRTVEIAFPESFGIIKVRIHDILRIGCGGELERKCR